jgi:tRNA (guanine-N7-)-methyltransferase
MHPFWRVVFSNDLPVEVEIGPGTGTFILAAAGRCPFTNFFGIEHSHRRAARLCAATEARRLGNARVIAADAACVVRTVIPRESVAAYHIYFPDPWWKRRHHRRRLFAPSFAASLERTLAPGGRLYLATDVHDVFALALETLAGFTLLSCDPAARSPRLGVTAFERKGLTRGATIKEATFLKRAVAPALAGRYTSSPAPITPAESPS